MIRLTEVWSCDTIQEYLDNGYNITKCPVCGNEAFDNWAICPHCWWEYDELMYKGYSCANHSYLWWYKLKYKIKQIWQRIKAHGREDTLELDPVVYIGALLGATKDGKLTLTHYLTDGSDAFPRVYEMDWTEEDAIEVAEIFVMLQSDLEQIGTLHDQLTDQQQAEKLLSPELLYVWQTYIEPFEDAGFNEEEIVALQMKKDLTEKEYLLLEAYEEWYEDMSLMRLPYERRNPARLISEARRYEQLIAMGESKDILEIYACALAEEMVLYYCMKRNAFECGGCGRFYDLEGYISSDFGTVCPACGWEDTSAANS